MKRPTFSGLQLNYVDVVSLLLPPKSAKSREILRKFELNVGSVMVIQGHRYSCQVITHYATPLFTNSKFGRFRDIDAFSSKIACFSHPPLFDEL